MRWAGIAAGVLGSLSFVVVARAEPVASPPVGGELPIAVASFPVAPAPVAPMHVDLTSTSAASPAVAPAAPAVSAPASPAYVTPSGTPALSTSPPLMAPSYAPSGDGAYCVESPTALELGALAIVRLIEDGAGLFAVGHVFGPSPDEQAFDNAAARELRRLTFMRRLSEMHDAENEREFSEKLATYLRKHEFLQAIETTHQLSPSPFESPRR